MEKNQKDMEEELQKLNELSKKEIKDKYNKLKREVRKKYKDKMPKKTKTKRIKVPKKLKNMIWDKNIGKTFGVGNCYCCSEEIDSKNFEAGHIISVKYGGETILDNLKPICSCCNKSMGAENLEIFKQKYMKKTPNHCIHAVREGICTNVRERKIKLKEKLREELREKLANIDKEVGERKMKLKEELRKELREKLANIDKKAGERKMKLEEELKKKLAHITTSAVAQVPMAQVSVAQEPAHIATATVAQVPAHIATVVAQVIWDEVEREKPHTIPQAVALIFKIHQITSQEQLFDWCLREGSPKGRLKTLYHMVKKIAPEHYKRIAKPTAVVQATLQRYLTGYKYYSLDAATKAGL